MKRRSSPVAQCTTTVPAERIRPLCGARSAAAAFARWLLFAALALACLLAWAPHGGVPTALAAAGGSRAAASELAATIVLSGQQVSDDDANGTLIGVLSVENRASAGIVYTLIDSAGGRFKLAGDQLLLADYTQIDSTISSSQTIVVEATDGSETWTRTFLIDVVGSRDIVVGPTAGGDPIGYQGAIASDGTDFAVGWIEGTAVKFTRVSPRGVVLDPGGIVIGQTTGYPGFPSVVWDGTNYFIVWVGTDSEIYGVRVTPGGTVIDTTPIKLTTNANAKLREPSIVYDGTNYFVVWRTNSGEIRCTRVSTTGLNLDSPSGVVLGYGFYPQVAYDGTNYLVVWYGNGITDLDVRANRVSAADGSVLDGSGFPVADAVGNQIHPSVAFDGTNYLVAWHDSRGPSIGINDGAAYAARVSTNGQVLDAQGFLVHESCLSESVGVIFDGLDYFVVWQTDNSNIDQTRLTDVYGQKVSVQGQPIGAPTRISQAHGQQFGPVVGQNSTQFFVAWGEDGPFQRGYGVWGHLLQKDLAPPPDTAPVAQPDSYQTDQDTPLVVSAPGVLANDTDADGDKLSAHKVTDPSHGSLTMSGGGSFIYTPAAGFHGTDSFTYRDFDGALYSAPTTVTIVLAKRAPKLTGFAPPSGPVGTSVTLTGTDLDGATAVAFNGTAAASFSVDSATQITAIVPAGATTGTIAVTTPGGTATSPTIFTFIPAPTLTGFTPASGPVGTSVILTGTGLSDASAVAFNGTAAASFSVDSATQITATVPAGATTGTIAVTTPGGTATSLASFTVRKLVTKLTITSNRTSAYRGQTVAYSGRISPNMANGTHVVVQIRKYGRRRWTTLSTRHTYSSHHWSYGYKIPRTHSRGTYFVHVRFAGNTKYRACVSASRKLVIK